jgi:hypothetical protein
MPLSFVVMETLSSTLWIFSKFGSASYMATSKVMLLEWRIVSLVLVVKPLLHDAGNVDSKPWPEKQSFRCSNECAL